jgi:hypothetical protein
MPAWLRVVGRFLYEWFRCAFAGFSSISRIFKVIIPFGTVLVALPFQLDDKVTVSLSNGSSLGWHPNMGLLISLSVLVIWAVIAAGIAWTRTRSALIKIGDHLEPDAEYRFFRLKIENEGYGKVETRVDVVKIVDKNGQNVLHPGLGPQEVHWSGIDGRREILTTGEGWHTVGLLSLKRETLTDWHLEIGTINGRYVPIDKNIPRNQSEKVWIKVVARDPHYVVAERWFAIEPDAAHPLHYKASTENPPFLTAQSSLAEKVKAFKEWFLDGVARAIRDFQARMKRPRQ